MNQDRIIELEEKAKKEYIRNSDRTSVIAMLTPEEQKEYYELIGVEL